MPDDYAVFQTQIYCIGDETAAAVDCGAGKQLAPTIAGDGHHGAGAVFRHQLAQQRGVALQPVFTQNFVIAYDGRSDAALSSFGGDGAGVLAEYERGDVRRLRLGDDACRAERFPTAGNSASGESLNPDEYAHNTFSSKRRSTRTRAFASRSPASMISLDWSRSGGFA